VIIRSEDPAANERIDRVALADPDVEATWRQSLRPVLVGERTARGRFIDGEMTALGFKVVSGRLPNGPSEAVIGYGLANATNLKIGDTTIVVLEGHLVTATIVGQVLDSSNLGRMITMPIDAIPPDKRWAFARALRFRPGVDKGAATARYRTLAQLPSANADTSSLQQRTRPYRIGLYSLSGLVMAVGLGQLAAALTLIHRNRGSTLATLSVLGMSDRTMITAHCIVAIGVGAVGCLAALPVGVWACRTTVTGIATDLGIGPGFVVAVPWQAFAMMSMCFLMACGLAAISLTMRHLRTHISSALVAG
jgi:putative ABC transport system permease protein